MVCRSASELAARAAASSVMNTASILNLVVEMSGAGMLELQLHFIPPLRFERDRRRHDDVRAVLLDLEEGKGSEATASFTVEVSGALSPQSSL
jgi:hypothetical protein